MVQFQYFSVGFVSNFSIFFILDFNRLGMSQNSQYQTLFTSSFLDLFYAKEGFLHADWKGYVNVNSVKEGCEAMLSYMKSTACFYILNDNRKVKGTWTQSIKWLEMDFMPRLVNNGLKKIAYLYSTDQSAIYSLNRLLEVNDQYEAQTFDTFEKATLWLLGKLLQETEQGVNEFLLLKTEDNYTKIQFDNIYYISIHNRKSIIQTKTALYTARKSLSDLMKMLPVSHFFRIHKSHIINIHKVKHLKYHAGGYYHLFLKDFGKIYLTVSKTKVKDLKMLLNL